MLPRWFLVLALAASAAAQETLPAAFLREQKSVEELLARDARISFTAETIRRARETLAAAPAEVGERALAAMALGCGRSSADLARIESIAAEGKLTEQRAALFALAELGADGFPALERALGRDTTGLEATLAVALLVAERRGASAAAARLEALAAGEGSLALPARLALAHRSGEPPGPLNPAVQLYYELRWRAAQTYGLVDGQRWQKARLAELLADEEFLDRVVLGAAADLSAPGLKTHLIEILPAGERSAALRVAAVRMPIELARAFQAGAWQPSSAGWQAVLAEIDARRSERAALPLLELAFRASTELEPQAGLLIFRAGGDLPWKWVGDQIERGGPERRAAFVRACGERGEKALAPDLGELIEKRPELELFGEGLVALARLGHEPAKEALEALVKGPASPRREPVLRALARVLHDRNLRRHALEALRRDDLGPELRADLEIALALAGESSVRERLRAALPEAEKHAKRVLAARALGQGADAADLTVLAALFPAEDDLDLNVELALALVRQRHASGLGILSAALWDDSWNRSVLAGGLIAEGIGLAALIDELDSAPRAATEADLRRVGFAVGEWGGVAAVEELARRRSEGDPAVQGALLGALSVRPEEPPATKPRTAPAQEPAPPKGAAKPAGSAKKKPGKAQRPR